MYVHQEGNDIPPDGDDFELKEEAKHKKNFPQNIIIRSANENIVLSVCSLI